MKRWFNWEENGRYYKMESHKNDAEFFFFVLCYRQRWKETQDFHSRRSGVDQRLGYADYKAKRVGIKEKTNEERVGDKTRVDDVQEVRTDEGGNTGLPSQKRFFAEIMKLERAQSLNTIWMDVGESMSRDDMGTLKFCLVGSWENPPDSLPSAMELEAWEKAASRLKESLMVAYMNLDLFILEFTYPEEAKWVIELGRRWFRGGSLKLEWRSLEVGCVKSKETVEVLIRVVVLSLYLCGHEVLKMIGDGDKCGGFLAIDKKIALRTEVL